MPANGGQHQVQETRRVGLREERLGHREERAQGLDARRVPFFLFICQRQPDGGNKFIGFFKGLEQQAVHSLAQGADGGLDGAEAGHHQHRDIGLGALGMGDHAETVHVGHADVHQQEVEAAVR